MTVSDIAQRRLDAAGQVDASDAVAVDCRRRLAERGYQALQRLTVDCQEGVLTLRGTLRSFYVKQIALTVAQQTEGVETVVDQIDIAD